MTPQTSRQTAVRAVMLASLVSATIAAAGTGELSAARAQDRQRSVTVAVLDRDGRAVPDLAADALTVREDGLAREVVRIAPAPPPSHVVLLVDDSQAAMPLVRDLRDGLTQFAERLADMSPAPEVRVTTFGDRPTVAVDFNPSFSAVSRGIDRIAPRPGSGATMLEALIETGQALRTRKAPRPMVVAFVVESGPEFSTSRHTDVADALRRAGASLWTIVLTSAGGGDSSADRERNIVLGDVTTESGGVNRAVLAGQQIPQAFVSLAATLDARYEVTYGRPDTLIPPKNVEVRARDSSLTVVTSRWAAP